MNCFQGLLKQSSDLVTRDEVELGADSSVWSRGTRLRWSATVIFRFRGLKSSEMSPFRHTIYITTLIETVEGLWNMGDVVCLESQLCILRLEILSKLTS